MDVAKVKALQKVLKDSEKEDKRLLVFSQVGMTTHFCSFGELTILSPV